MSPAILAICCFPPTLQSLSNFTWTHVFGIFVPSSTPSHGDTLSGLRNLKQNCGSCSSDMIFAKPMAQTFCFQLGVLRRGSQKTDIAFFPSPSLRSPSPWKILWLITTKNYYKSLKSDLVDSFQKFSSSKNFCWSRQTSGPSESHPSPP